MSEQEQQGQEWEYCVLSTVSRYKSVSAFDAIVTELSYLAETYSTVKVNPDSRRRVIHDLGHGGWEMVSAQRTQISDVSGATGDMEAYYFKRPVKEDRKITEPKIEG